jgi:hypothetical protein
LTLRTFDVDKHRWSVYWVSSKTGRLDTPVVGGFAGDRGEFYGDDEDGGRAVRVRLHVDQGRSRARALGAGVLVRGRQMGGQLEGGLRPGRPGDDV